MRSKTLILLVLALGCGLVASIGISQILQRQDQTAAGDTSPLWVVMTDIKRNDPLTMQNLKLEQWPKEKIPPGALTKLEEIEGKRARVALYSGEAVLDKKILNKDQLDISTTVPPGYRLFTVAADGTSSNGGLLHPDDRVDVLVYIAKSNGISVTGTKTILEDILVFAVNDQVRMADDKANDSISAKTVTLLVTPSQAEKLALANEIGKIHLDMRGPSDKGSSNPNGTTLKDILITDKSDRDSEEMNHPPVSPKTSPLTALLNQSAQPTPTAAPQAEPAPAPAPVQQETFEMQVIRGTEISELDFKKKLDDPTRWDNGSSTSIGGSPSTTPEAEQPKLESQKPSVEKKGGAKAAGAADGKPSILNQGSSQAGGHA